MAACPSPVHHKSPAAQGKPSSLMACSLQEAIKLITRQFVPVGGVLVYNGMQCTTSIFDF